MGKRAQRIPSWPGVIHSNKGRIHLRRPTRDITFRLRRSGGPYIPSGPSAARNGHKRWMKSAAFQNGTAVQRGEIPVLRLRFRLDAILGAALSWASRS